MEFAIGLITIVIGIWAALETRRQRKITQAALPEQRPAASTLNRPEPVWACGIYDYPPLSDFPAPRGGEPRGILVELAANLLDQIKQPYRFVHFNYDGFSQEGTILPDLIVGMFDTPRRRRKMVFSRPFYEIGLQGICRSDQAGDLLSRLRDGDLRVAVYSGEVGWEFLQDEIPDAIEDGRAVIVQGGRQGSTMSLLAQKDADVVLMDSVSCVSFLRKGSNARRFQLAFAQPLKTFDCCIALDKRHADRLDTINGEIERIRNSEWFRDREAKALRGMEDLIAKRGVRIRKRT